MPGSNDKDFRVYMSCVLRTAINCFQKIIITCKRSKGKKTPVPTRVVTSYDDTSLHRMAGAMLRKMLRKRFSDKYYRRLTAKRQHLTKSESNLLRPMCLSKAEKQSLTTKLPVGFQVLDKEHLLVLKPRILQFVRHFSILFKTNVNSQKYSSLGSQMFKIAKKNKNKKKTRQHELCFLVMPKMCVEILLFQRTLSRMCTPNSQRNCNTMANEYMKKVKFLSLTAAQVMLRDKLKVYASKTASGRKSKKWTEWVRNSFLP